MWQYVPSFCSQACSEGCALLVGSGAEAVALFDD
jgi:hypothetical protein